MRDAGRADQAERSLELSAARERALARENAHLEDLSEWLVWAGLGGALLGAAVTGGVIWYVETR